MLSVLALSMYVDSTSQYAHSSEVSPCSFLTLQDHQRVKYFLKGLDNQEIIDVGIKLGLHYSTLKKMSPESLLNDMVSAWLKRHEDVAKKSGEPSWESLCTALEDCGYTGTASDIKKGKGWNVNRHLFCLICVIITNK